MAKITLEFDVDHLASYYEPDTGYGEIQSIEDAIVMAAATALITRYSGKIDEMITARIVQWLDETVEQTVRARVEALTIEAITDEYPVLNSFGKSTEETTSIQEQAQKLIHLIMTEKVDYQGKPRKDGYGNRDDKPRWAWHLENTLRQEIDNTLKHELDRVVRDAQSQAKTRIAEHLLKLGEK